MSQRPKKGSSSDRFKARARAARRQALRPVAAVALGALGAAAIGWALLASGLLAVHEVSVRGVHRLSTAAVVTALGTVKGDALLTIDTSELEHRVERLPGVRSASITRQWPSTVRVEVVERTPIATVHRPDGWWLVDATGVEFGPAGPRQSTLREVKLPPAGESADAARSAALVLAALPSPLLATVSRVEASSADSVRLRLTSGATVVWGSPERSPEKARILATLVHRHARVYDVSSPSVVTTR